VKTTCFLDDVPITVNNKVSYIHAQHNTVCVVTKLPAKEPKIPYSTSDSGKAFLYWNNPE